MPKECIAGKVRFDADEVLSLVAGHELWPRLMQEIVIDRALRATMAATPEEIAAYYHAQLEADPGFLGKKRERLLLEGATEGDVDFFLFRPLLLEKFKIHQFAPRVEQTFIELKSGLDSITFAMIRNRDHELVRELYFRIHTGEEKFEDLAERYSEGREALSGGLVGPIMMKNLNPALASVLASAETDVVKPPFVIDGAGVIVMPREKIPARLDDDMRRKLIEQLFVDWLKLEIQSYFF
ncbi:MAG: peptidylprolyl isomerase [Chlorobiaceae bacterium]|nr:peptidylprolyl isomerase [Chlorobiaceae bacterium]